jgi:FkbM family methyltransferase
LLSRWVANGRVIAFEAHPTNASILKENMRLNGCDNVTVVGNAVGPDYPVHIRDRSNSAVQASIRKSLTVDCVSIDRYCKDNSIIPDIIKIDVEGFEIDVLEGAREILKSRPALFIEVHSEVLYQRPETVTH